MIESDGSQHTRNQVEDARHQRAFDLYLSMRPRRSYRRVAQQMGISVSTVKLWSKQHHWRQRCIQREVEESRKLADSIEARSERESDRNIKIVNMAILKIAKAIAEGRVKASMGDLDRMVRLEERLTGIHGISPRMLARAASYLEGLQTLPMTHVKATLREMALDLGVIRHEELAEEPVERISPADSVAAPQKGQNLAPEGSERDSAETEPAGGP